MENTSKLIKTYKTPIPASKFVGKCYREEDKKNGTFSWAWCDWFSRNLFAPLEALGKDVTLFDDCHSAFGFCKNHRDGTYEYWIGTFLPEDTEVPEGYDSFSVPACDGIVNWVYGKEPDIYFHCCLEEMEAQGFFWEADSNGDRLMAERYACPRFTDVDAEGNRTIDLMYFTNFHSNNKS